MLISITITDRAIPVTAMTRPDGSFPVVERKERRLAMNRASDMAVTKIHKNYDFLAKILISEVLFGRR